LTIPATPERLRDASCGGAIQIDGLYLSLPLPLAVIFPNEPGLTGFIEANDDGSGGDNWSYKSCKAPVTVTTKKPTPSFLQTGCPSCHPTNSVTALTGKFCRQDHTVKKADRLVRFVLKLV